VDSRLSPHLGAAYPSSREANVDDKVKSIEVQCTTCRTWFRSPIFFESFGVFEQGILYNNKAQCPKGHMTGVDKENVRVFYEKGGFRGSETT
jgi:hypothetical protein